MADAGGAAAIAGRLRPVAVALLMVSYAIVAHYTNISGRADTLGAVVALAPLVIGAFVLAWQSSYRMLMLLLCAGAGVVLLSAWSTVERHFSFLYWAEHAGTQLMMGAMFFRTLREGKVAMVTTFARMVHGTLTPDMERYTRQCTLAWVGFFVSMATTSTLLFAAAPLAVWSVFANFITGPLILLMFVAEYIVRRRLHPHFEHADFLAAIRAFRSAPARQ